MSILQTEDLAKYGLDNLVKPKLVLYKDPNNLCWVASCDTTNGRRAVWDFPPDDEGKQKAIHKLEQENINRIKQLGGCYNTPY